MSRQLRILCSPVPRPTHLLSSASTLARENQRRPRKECSSRATSTKFVSTKIIRMVKKFEMSSHLKCVNAL